MARKQAKRPVEAPKLTKVVYRGSTYPEYQGKSFQVPAGSSNPGRLVEQQIAAEIAAKAAEEAAAAAQAAKDSADQAMLAERIEQVKAEPEVVVEEPVVEAPAPSTGNDQLALSVSLSNLTSNLLIQSKAVEELEASVASMIATTAERLAAIESEGISKEEALALIKNNIELQNAAFNEYAKNLNGFQEQLNQQRVDIDVAALAISDARETVEKASRINEEAVNIAKATAEEEAARVMSMSVAVANATLRASGVTRSQFLQILNAGQVQGEQAVIASEAELMAYVRMTESFADATAEADRQIDLSSRTAADIFGQPGGTVGDGR